jgi:hypothetical protein
MQAQRLKICHKTYLCRKKITYEWDSKGTVFLWRCPEAAPLAGLGRAQKIEGASQGVNQKTVQWTVF